MANKLKKMHLTSVDLVRRGANQEADICLFKGMDPSDPTEQPTENETNIFKRFINWLRENPTETENGLDNIEKDCKSFDIINENRKNEEDMWKYTSALTESIRSIVDDNSIDDTEKLELMEKSLSQFDAAMTKLFGAIIKAKTVDPVVIKSDADRYDIIQEVSKANPWHGKDGRFTSGPGGAVGGVAHRTMTQGGISYHVKSGKEPKSGYMCATYTDRSTWLKGDDVTDPEKRTTAIKSFMEKNKDVLSDPDNYLGTWFDSSTGNISLDISRNFSSKSEAIKFASEHNEKAIWDVKNMAEIPTGGTGNNI